MKKMMAALMAMMITLSGCSAVLEKEEPAKAEETQQKVSAPVGHWMAEEPNDKYPNVLFLERNGTGMAFGNTIGWMLRGDTLYIENNFIKGELEFVYEEDGTMYLDGHPYVPWKLER